MYVTAEQVLTSLGVAANSKSALFRHGFNDLTNYHSLTNFKTIQNVKHLKLPDVPVTDQKLLGHLIHRLEGHEDGKLLRYWDTDVYLEFLQDEVQGLRPWIPAGARPEPSHPFMMYQGLYPTYDKGLTEFFQSWDDYVTKKDFDTLRETHGVNTVFDLANMESALNTGTVNGVSPSCQYILGRAITWCRLNRVWLTHFDDEKHKLAMLNALLFEDLNRNGIPVTFDE